MNGILNVLKPPGMTSFDVVSYLRGVLKMKKIGHTGTLDPGVAGVLPVCTGQATKVIEYLTQKDKSYRAELTLGITTDTQDSSGRVLDVKAAHLSQKDIIESILSFRGQSNQLPPMYSAVKVGGVKLYEMARKGMTIERTPRQIMIHSINILNIERDKVLFDVSCSKGTYIRTLCADIGEKLGCGGHMSFLIRTKSGPFELKDACPLTQINALAKEGRIQEKLERVDKVFDNITSLYLEQSEVRKIMNGVWLDASGLEFPEGTRIKLYDGSEEFIALGEVMVYNNKKCIKALKLFSQKTT